MQFINQKKYLILSVVFFLFFCATSVFLYQKTKDYNKEALSLQEEWQTENVRRENVKYLSSSVKTIQSEIASLESHFVKSSDVVPFLDTIEKLANDMSLKSEISSVDVNKVNPVLMVEMRVQGSFENIYKLIRLLENSQYELEFVSVNIQEMENSTAKIPQWNAALMIKLLSFEI
jgi:hypothetical protein